MLLPFVRREDPQVTPGEAARLYQAALEERRTMRDRGDDEPGRMDEINREVERTSDELWEAWRGLQK